MSSIKGPAIFLAQFINDKPPFDSLENLCQWASGLGYKGIQIPSWEARLIDLDLASSSIIYCDELKGKIGSYGLEITELASHLQGQLVACHPAYDRLFAPFAPSAIRTNADAKQEWAADQLRKVAKASRNLGLKAQATFSGALMWHTIYPWPQRPQGLVELGFKELARRWRPILEAHADNDVFVCFELHPGEDLHDGITFERFLEVCEMHEKVCINYDPSHFVLQQMDYLGFIDIYHERIKAFHVKDAEYLPSAKSGVYGGYQSWIDRPGRFRSLGDGQIDFKSIFSKLTQYGYDSWAVLEWECCIKSSEQGAREGAPFIQSHIIQRAERAFDDFAGGREDSDLINHTLGI